MAIEKIKLTYFDAEGICEHLRILSHMIGCQFEDVRLGMGEWMAMKATTSYTSLPIAEITLEGGETIILNQSRAIAIYLGSQIGLYPENPKDQARIHDVMAKVIDIHSALYPIKYVLASKPGAEKKLTDYLMSEEGRAYRILKSLSQTLGEQSPYILGNQFSIGDLVLYTYLIFLTVGILQHVPKESILCHPNILDYMKRVRAEPRVAAYLDTLEDSQTSFKTPGETPTGTSLDGLNKIITEVTSMISQKSAE